MVSGLTIGRSLWVVASSIVRVGRLGVSSRSATAAAITRPTAVGIGRAPVLFRSLSCKQWKNNSIPLVTYRGELNKDLNYQAFDCTDCMGQSLLHKRRLSFGSSRTGRTFPVHSYNRTGLRRLNSCRTAGSGSCHTLPVDLDDSICNKKNIPNNSPFDILVCLLEPKAWTYKAWIIIEVEFVFLMLILKYIFKPSKFQLLWLSVSRGAERC